MGGLMVVAVGADHAGVALKDSLVVYLRARGVEVVDFGTHGPASVDYPDFAVQVARAVAGRRADSGLLVCGTGQGMAMAANKIAGVRAAVVAEPFSAAMTRAHNDANVLCIGARVVGGGVAEAILDAWLATPFEGGRHARRVGGIVALDAARAGDAG
jgi:ribose 5-phosphate isomerase B